MSLFVVLAQFFRLCTDFIGVWFWGSMLHQLLARVNYFPSLLRLSLMVGPERRWYDRVDGTVLLGALPFRSQTKQLVEHENVRAVLSYNEAYELNYFTNSKDEWARSGVQHHWFSTIDFQPPTLPVIWQGLRVIDEFKAKKQCVYVHCKAGRGRSAVVTTCYLMKSYNFGPSEAIEFLRQKRPQINMNSRQRKVVCDFHEQLKTKTD